MTTEGNLSILNFYTNKEAQTKDNCNFSISSLSLQAMNRMTVSFHTVTRSALRWQLRCANIIIIIISIFSCDAIKLLIITAM